VLLQRRLSSAEMLLIPLEMRWGQRTLQAHRLIYTLPALLIAQGRNPGPIPLLTVRQEGITVPSALRVTLK